ncbi:MAG: ribosome recycling factor [Gammaproteobacteria bacterium]|nr:ribosome recycling factor [Gammaproteobacteria bacterium]
MLDEICADAKSRMQKAVEVLAGELKKLRTGRAHPSLLEHIKVNFYGTDTPLSQMANVSVSDPRTLSISPWDKTSVQAIEKAIMNSNLGLNPNTAGSVIRVPMPPLTEERRRDLVRVVKQEAEAARVAIRNIRRDANGDFKELLKEKDISEDDERRAQERIQKLTDQFVAEVDKAMAQKEADLLEV